MTTLNDIKRKSLAMIEELNPESQNMTDDPDIAAKLIEIINQRMFELARHKKIAKYTEMNVVKGDLITLENIGDAVGYEVYQVGNMCGVKFVPKANNTVFKMLESGTLEVDCFVYPEKITEKTSGNYEFELSQDVMEIMPYGVAADLLKSDPSSNYGRVYAEEYERLKQMLDPRNGMTSIYIEGGVRF